MNKLLLNTTNTEELEKLLLINVIGLIEALKKDLLTIEETEKVLFNPYTIDLLQSKGISKEILEIIHLGTELEDIVSLMSEKLFESLSEIEYESIAQLEQRKAYKFRNKVIESIN